MCRISYDEANIPWDGSKVYKINLLHLMSLTGKRPQETCPRELRQFSDVCITKLVTRKLRYLGGKR
jgi:hypothetical protein